MPIVGVGRDRRGRRSAGAAVDRGNQPVLGVVAIGEDTIKGVIAVAVIGRADRANGGILIEIVCGVADGAWRCRGIRPENCCRWRLADALVGRIVGKGESRSTDSGRRLGFHRAETGGGEVVQGVIAVAHRRNNAAHGRCDRSAGVGNADGVTREITGITDHGRWCGRRLGREPVQPVVGVGDRLPGTGLSGLDIVVGVICKLFGAAVRIGRSGESIEPVIGEI